MSDPYVQNIRRALKGERTSRGDVPIDWQKGQTANHEGAIVVGNYSLDPTGSWRAELIKWLTNMLEVKGLWCSRFDDEFGSTSHKAHHYAWQDACLLFALKNGDREVLDLIMRIECGVHAVESLCATPKGDIVMTGARCHYGDPKAADQRKQGSKRWQWLMGQKIKMPEVLATADDWLGLHCLTLIQAAYEAGEEWAQTWGIRNMRPGVKETIRTSDDMPILHNAITVERGPMGHVVKMLTVDGCIRPALWAVADYESGAEVYGVNPAWEQGFKGAKIGDVPLPVMLPKGGKVTTVGRAR